MFKLTRKRKTSNPGLRYKINEKNAAQEGGKVKYQVDKLVPINMSVENCKKILNKAKSANETREINEIQLRVISDKSYISHHVEEKVDLVIILIHMKM